MYAFVFGKGNQGKKGNYLFTAPQVLHRVYLSTSEVLNFSSDIKSPYLYACISVLPSVSNTAHNPQAGGHNLLFPNITLP